MVLLVSTVPVAADPPPWAVESPAAAEARFGLGLDYLFEHQESLRIDSQRTVVSLPTANGGTLDDIVHGDPDLLNRKFDLEWELKGPGVSVPLALSSFRLTDLIEVFPTLTLEAASVDVTLDSISKTESNPKVTLEGRGSLFGARLGVTASLCGDCPWFNGTTYHYRSLPAFEADRSPTFAEPGFEVLHDEVRLSQEVHEVSTKFGYIAPNKRVAYYTGVRTRWTDVEIEDELRLRSLGYGQRTSPSSRTKLDSNEILAVAGMDMHLGGSVYARTETAFGNGDYGVLVKISYVGPNLPEAVESTEETRKRKLEPPVVAPTLRLFWKLANLQLRDPSTAPRLLGTDPQDPAKVLDALGIGFKRYRKELAEVAGVRPLVLFLSHGTEPVEEARRRGLDIAPWPRLAPPALLFGPEVDTLILFETLTSARTGLAPAGATVQAQIASLANLASLVLAESESDEQSWTAAKLYSVAPVPLERSAMFYHTRCVDPTATHLRVSLTYAGGIVDRPDPEDEKLERFKPSWQPCAAPHGGLRSVTIPQRTRKNARSPVIAGSFYHSDDAVSPLITKWLRVK